jgi:hypothetical protein
MSSGYNKFFFDIMLGEDGMTMFSAASKSFEAGQASGHFVHGCDWAAVSNDPLLIS